MAFSDMLDKLILKDSSGAPSWSLSLAVMAFFVTVFLMFFGGQKIDITIGKFALHLSIAPIDAGVIAIFFPSSIALYFARRYTSAKWETSNFTAGNIMQTGGIYPGFQGGGPMIQTGGGQLDQMEFSPHGPPPVVRPVARSEQSKPTLPIVRNPDEVIELDDPVK